MIAAIALLLFTVGCLVFPPLVTPPTPLTGTTTTLNYQVNASEYDGQQGYSGDWGMTMSYVQIISGDNYADGCFAFFPAIPQGAEITSATLSVYVFSTFFDDANLDVYGEDVDNGEAFGSGHTNLRDRSITTASTEWVQDGVGTGWKDLNVKDIVQEIVNRNGWQSGNRMNFIFKAKSGTQKKLYVRTYDYDTSLAAKLEITYQSSQPPQASNINHNSTSIGSVCEFSSYWEGSSLSHGIFSWNASGEWQNDTVTDPWTGTPNSGWFNVTKTLPYFIRVIGYRFYVNDTNGWGDSGIHSLTTTQPDQVETTTLKAVSIEENQSKPDVWTNLGSGFEFKGYNEWVTQDVADTYGRWVKLYGIITDDSLNYLKGYEIEIYDADSSSWISPTSVYDQCGGSNPSNFIDGSTSTYWTHNNPHQHWIIVDLGGLKKVGQVRIYVGSSVSCNWSCSIDVGYWAEWYTKGTEPWINATDYPNNYIWTSQSGKTIGNFRFQNKTIHGIKEVKLFANVSISGTAGGIHVYYWNVTFQKWDEAENVFSATNGEWQVKDTVLFTFVTNHFLNRTKIKFKTEGSATYYIDEAYLNVTYFNITSVTSLGDYTQLGGRTAITVQTSAIHAMFYIYLDSSTGYYKITAYDIVNFEWITPYAFKQAPQCDGHWQPSIGVFPNGSLGAFWGYYSTINYTVSTYSTKTESNVTKLIRNWGEEQEIPVSSGLDCYPTPISYNDCLLVFHRKKQSMDGNFSVFKFTEQDGWSVQQLVYTQDRAEWKYHSQYWTVKKERNNKIYVVLQRMNDTNNNEEPSRQNIYLLISEDKGETWKHWNGTVLTNLPVEIEQLLVQEVKPSVHLRGVWEDEQGKVNILVLKTTLHWWTDLDYLKPLKILYSNTSLPNNNVEWTYKNITDTYGNYIYGSAIGFYDKDLNKSVIWVAGQRAQGLPYSQKYVCETGEIYRLYVTLTEHKIYRQDFTEVQDYTIPYEATGVSNFWGMLGYEEDASNYWNGAGKLYGFKYRATRSGTITGIVFRVNSTEVDETFMVAIYNSSFHRLGYSGAPFDLIPGAPPELGADTWIHKPLTEKVEIEEGETYWLCVWTTAKVSIHYKEVSDTQAAFEVTAGHNPPPETLNSDLFTWHNRTASASALSSRITTLGLPRRPICQIYGTNVTTPQVNDTAFFYSKWYDFCGLEKIDFWHNKTSSWQNITSYNNGANQAWHNTTLYLNVSEGTVIKWYFEATNSKGQTYSTDVEYFTVGVTMLNVGWNNFTAWNVDVGHTLLDVNASLHIDNINFTTITFSYPNGTQISLYWEQSTNTYWVENSVMTVTSDSEICIYCKEAGEWYHNYGS